eukprot:5087534-Karenia_brevis.AAC.1
MHGAQHEGVTWLLDGSDADESLSVCLKLRPVLAGIAPRAAGIGLLPCDICGTLAWSALAKGWRAGACRCFALMAPKTLHRSA